MTDYRDDHSKYGEAKDLIPKQQIMNDRHHRDDHSPDIALLLAVARATRACAFSLGATDHWKEIDAAMKPFERYPDPVETEEIGA